MAASVNARSILLNAMRVAPQHGLPVRRLLEIGALFGFTGNAVRVAMTRMQAAGLVESDARGRYRMGAAARPLSAHVEGWRRGEARMRAWDGGWLAVALGTAPDRAARRASLRALSRLGMVEGLPGFWLRPDNLAAPLDATLARLRDLGLEPQAEPMRCADLSERLQTRLRSDGWPRAELERGYAHALAELERSTAQLPGMPRDAALVQTFLVGGAAIRVLATDPLLPEAIMPGATRAALTERMLEYDAIGHRLWNQAASRPVLKLVAGGKSRKPARRKRKGAGDAG